MSLGRQMEDGQGRKKQQRTMPFELKQHGRQPRDRQVTTWWGRELQRGSKETYGTRGSSRALARIRKKERDKKKGTSLPESGLRQTDRQTNNSLGSLLGLH